MFSIFYCDKILVYDICKSMHLKKIYFIHNIPTFLDWGCELFLVSPWH